MPTRTPRRSRVRPGLIALGLAIVVIVVAAFNVTVVSIDDVNAGAGDTFDPVAFAEEEFSSTIVPAIEEEAIDLPTLLADLAAGADEADFGNTSGASSAYAFPVTFTAVAGELAGPVLGLTVDGVPAETTVQLQVGPALNGTAMRDVTGEISFNSFVNQLEYQNVATELNNQVREQVLSTVDPASLPGKTLEITGAFLRVNPALVSVVPVKIEVMP
jgi:predicted lipoprotein